MSENENRTLGWMIVELLGHRKLGGHVKEETLAGAGFLRIDIYARAGEQRSEEYVRLLRLWNEVARPSFAQAA